MGRSTWGFYPALVVVFIARIIPKCPSARQTLMEKAWRSIPACGVRRMQSGMTAFLVWLFLC